MRASRTTGSNAAISAASMATPSSSKSCSGNTSNGNRQPNAFTFTIAIRHQATRRPSGSANSAVISATDSVLISSIAARRDRVMPIAHSGANCGSRELPRVNRLVNKRDAGDAEREGVQRGGDRKGPVEYPQRLRLHARLVRDIAVIKPELLLQVDYQRRDPVAIDAQAQVAFAVLRESAGSMPRH